MPQALSSYDLLSEQLAAIAWQAGELLQVMRPQTQMADIKSDGSPVTLADRESEKIILDKLQQNWPDIPVLSEESGGTIKRDAPFFMVDPLDGTRDYIRPEGEYTVNISLIINCRPVSSVIAAPEAKRIWIAGDHARTAHIISKNSSAFTSPDEKIDWKIIKTRKLPAEGGIALISRRRNDNRAEKIITLLPVKEKRTASSAIKFCWLAEGKADFYIRCRPTMEWDTAAGGHILEKAGGVLFGFQHCEFLYGRHEKHYLNGAFAALGDPSFKDEIILPEAADP